MKPVHKLFFAVLLLPLSLLAQNGLVSTGNSPKAALNSVGISDVQWTKGFWAERFAVCRDAMLPQLWQTYTSKNMCYSFQNFRVAAGLDTGRFRGPSFHDGDFYKTLEAVAAMYASTKDAKLEAWMDEAIAVIGKAQKADGYIYTKNIIEQRKTGSEKMFDDQLSFEAYNFGHLMTAACVHYRATGKTTLLNIASKAADFLIGFYKSATPEQARNAICPSHYMGLTELYRTTNEKKYLDLVIHLINIRGSVEGTDDNSDRAPFRDMQKIAGHAVRANYLLAGVADVYAETGDPSLLTTLHRLWNNVILSKMYVTGGCGALYDGVSVDGTSYKPDTVQKVHQSYGRDFQLPNLTAHNETCANIGNVLWNWRMFLLTGESKYTDIVELALYNSVLSGVSLDGGNYFYTNPLAASDRFPYHMRWEGGRIPYISKSNCCPPNVVRTIAEVNSYMYSIGEKGLYINMYGGSQLSTTLHDGQQMILEQQTNYPWQGNIAIHIKQSLSKSAIIFFRIPGWCNKYTLLVNGKVPHNVVDRSNGYIGVKSSWQKGDKIELRLDMPVTLLESNPLVEETRGQVTVKRGPIVYCLESADLPQHNIFDVAIPASAVWQTKPLAIAGSTVTALTTTAKVKAPQTWSNTLYQPLNNQLKAAAVTLIPYYAWANRGKTDMTVWMPVVR
ncbi:aceric acid hydrolase [Phnomibacter ginsenosidimutans]|uniref:Glycoside hydrolase family 127 protein n=1 Tax=Phnomibacter ginsenosidimutans TaxID=2676868 RepID=A0A6I6G8K9_9BACT|nr:glycoside hydrolase family 127 protein [Phnomibacter ginsenosidimutans]QGW28837.1 glycoside hydrolase family 127 protein [Phnomibacter ginsenosidimutans]